MDPTKPSYKTGEFWLSAAAHGVIAILAYTQLQGAVAGLPNWVIGLLGIALAYLNGKYQDNRTDLKKSALAAGIAASTTPEVAAAALGASLKK